MFTETVKDVVVPISGDSLALTTLQSAKFELDPIQNETVVAAPWGFTEPFSCTPSEVTFVSRERVTVGGAGVVKLNMLPDTC
jgi:hypothetical protein